MACQFHPELFRPNRPQRLIKGFVGALANKVKMDEVIQFTSSILLKSVGQNHFGFLLHAQKR